MKRSLSVEVPHDIDEILESYYYSAALDDPADGTDVGGLTPRLELTNVSKDGGHGTPVFPTFPWSLFEPPATPKSLITLRVPTSLDNRDYAILRRADSRPFPTSPDSPPLDKADRTFLYAPSKAAWCLINPTDWYSPRETVVRPEPSWPSTPPLRRKGHIRRASEPLDSMLGAQSHSIMPPVIPSITEDTEVFLSPGLAEDSPELSPLSSTFEFPATPSDYGPITEVQRNIFIQIIGASGLAQTGVLMRSPKPYADVTIGSQGFRTPTAERRTTAPIWNSDFLFESVEDTDSIVIRVWTEAGPNSQRTWLGSFKCTIRRMLLMQAVNEVLTFTLDRWPYEGHAMESTRWGSIKVRIRDLASPLGHGAFTQVNDLRSRGSGSEVSRHHKYPSTPSFFDAGTRIPPAIPLVIITDEDEPNAAPRTQSTQLATDMGNRPRWFGDVMGRTLSLSRSEYPWVPRGDVAIQAGPVSMGGYCDIYLGELRREGVLTQVALKQLRVFTNASDTMKKLFCREVKFWGRLRHPNVLPFWGCYELDEYRLFMVSPWAVNGNSLQYVKKHPEVDRRRILRQTAGALAYLHSGQDGDALIHGDLKADNVLISDDGDALLADFGLTRYVEKSASISLTPSGLSPHGHIRFSAPELLCPPPDKDPRPTPESDVFAFAGLLIQLYSEEPPFANIKRDVQVFNEIILGNKPSRPVGAVTQRGLDDDLWALANECWRFLPILRPSINEVAERLR